MEIRCARLTDAPAWNELVVAVKSENLPVLYGMSSPITVESSTYVLKKILDTAGSFVLLCFDGDKAVASVDLLKKTKPEESHVASFGLCVLKPYRGQGIGTQLMAAMLELCQKDQLVKKIEIEVFANNEVGLKLYTNMGFEVEGRRKNSIVKDGEYLDVILMGRSL